MSRFHQMIGLWGKEKRVQEGFCARSLGLTVFLLVLLCCCSQSRTPLGDSDSGSEDALPYYALKSDASVIATCGNGIIEPNELCDDGNITQGDHCSSDCQSVDFCPKGVLEGDYEYPNRNGFDLQYLSKCSRILGDLLVASDLLDNVDPLDVLERIDGRLIIFEQSIYSAGYPHEMSLEGFSNLESIGGDLEIVSVSAISSLEGFERLSSIGGNLRIEENENLISLEGLHNLTEVGGDVSIRYNEKRDRFSSEPVAGLESLNGLDSLISIGGGLSLYGKKLHNFGALRNLESVGGHVLIESTAATELGVLSNLKFVGDSLSIVFNLNLEQLFVPNSAITIVGPVTVENNESLPSCLAQSFEEALRQIDSSIEFSECENKEDECGTQVCHYESK